jgi:hypothetical protein
MCPLEQNGKTPPHETTTGTIRRNITTKPYRYTTMRSCGLLCTRAMLQKSMTSTSSTQAAFVTFWGSQTVSVASGHNLFPSLPLSPASPFGQARSDSLGLPETHNQSKHKQRTGGEDTCHTQTTWHHSVKPHEGKNHCTSSEDGRERLVSLLLRTWRRAQPHASVKAGRQHRSLS